MELRAFQNTGVEFMLRMNGNCILGDEMGLGKTVQAIEYIKRANEYPVLIICPCSLKYNWVDECNKWGLHDNCVVNGKWSYAPVTILNYDLLHKYELDIIKVGYKVIIWDESTYLKTYTSRRSKIAVQIAATIPKHIFLSGTPILDRPRDLYTVLNILGNTYPVLAMSYRSFTIRYCNAGFKYIPTMYGQKRIWDDSGASNKQELHNLLSNYMLRRLKQDVLTELPAKTKSIIPICNGEDNVDALFKAEIAGTEQDNYQGLPKAALIEQYRMWAVEKKMAESIKFISEIAENEKVVVGIHHRKPGQDIMLALAKYKPLSISGGDTPEHRQQAVNDFQTKPEHRVIIVSIKAGGMGITLNAASKVVIMQPTWTPGELTQFEDRCHRLGQINPVNIYYLTLRNSIEAAMFHLLIEKNKTITEIVEGKKEQQTLF